MLCNRVNPFGELIRTAARGGFMGNRGLIHNERQEITRSFRLKAWITCLLEFKGRQRQVMTPGLYTELFFLDEATAFAAGHRPCAECRREDFNRFKKYWLAANPDYGFNAKTPVKYIDEIMQQERMAGDGSKVTYREEIVRLPDGTFIEHNGEAYLLMEGKTIKWTAFGYTEEAEIRGQVSVLTPRSVVKTFAAGYNTQWKK